MKIAAAEARTGGKHGVPTRPMHDSIIGLVHKHHDYTRNSKHKTKETEAHPRRLPTAAVLTACGGRTWRRNGGRGRDRRNKAVWASSIGAQERDGAGGVLQSG